MAKKSKTGTTISVAQSVDVDVEIGIDEVERFIDHCTNEELKSIVASIKNRGMETTSLSDLTNANNLADDEKLTLFVKHIQSIDYSELEKFCTGAISYKGVA